MSYSLVKNGFELIPSVLTEKEVEALRASLSLMEVAPGHRNLIQRVPDIAALAVSPKIMGLLEGLLGAEPFPVRSIFFDKTPEANWLVPWHQDLSIAVKQRLDVSGYGPWSTKDGVPHVQPPVEILETMVTLRLHLDDCLESNGPLRVIPGSHRLGRLDPVGIVKVRSNQKEVVCSVRAGDALLMRPLLLHASSEASPPAHRRVIHLEYATRSIPKGLEWAEISGTPPLSAGL
jgi:ectoine hydroxylase-related dioxygenase (phytanoyl-CoA dioxygenase family)